MKIFVTSGYGWWENFLPTDLEKGDSQIGGGETAMIQVSKHLAKLGHDVLVFHDIARPGRYDGVDYLPRTLLPAMVTLMEHDVYVSWDDPYAFRWNDRSKVHVLAIQLNDSNIGVFDNAIDLYMHPSEWHSERFLELYPEMSKDKVRPRTTNGIDPNRYIQAVEREPHRVIYSSSPDRGLHHLLRIWPLIRDAVADAELHVFYDTDKWLEMDLAVKAQGLNSMTGARADLIRDFLKEPPDGVTFHGGVGQAQLALEQQKSAVLAYPCDPVQPTEGFSMTCLEAVTAGCHLITTDADALKELWADAPDTTIIPLPIDDAVWVTTLIEILKAGQNGKAREKVHPSYTWTGIAKKWEGVLEECL